MTQFRIRRARADDAAACAALYAPFVTDTWVSFEAEPPTAAEMLRRIRDYGQSHGWLVAVKGTQVIGYAYGSPHRTRAAYASSCDIAIYVDPAFARQGIGRALMGELLDLLSGKCHAAFAGIALPNDASIALHEACGFTPVGVYKEVGWKMDGWRDVAWWQRIL